MSVAQKINSINADRGILVPVIGAAMSLPIVMFSLMGYDINPAFLLAPLIGIAFLMNFGRTGLAYISAMVLGLVSIVAASKLSPDGEMVRHVFSLILIMFAPSFIFLGKYVSKEHDIAKVFYWLSLFSALFLIFVTVRIFFLEQAVRIYVGPLGLAAMNAEFFGLPVFATFGVLSLAHLVCLQALILCGTLIGGKASRPVSAVIWIALFCATFLIIGSDSRSAQILLVWILGSVIVYALRNASARLMCGAAVLAMLMAFGVTYVRGMSESRLVSSIEVLSGYEEPGVSSAPSVPGDSGGTDEKEDTKQMVEKADQFATGRVELAIAGVKEVIASPFIGNGFGGYGRYNSEGMTPALEANSSTHVYYLTLLWKGGLIFFIPFVAMILLNLKSAITRTKSSGASAERFFAWAAVLMAFGPMALAWDILIVPSAGALAFFLFGMLAARKKV
ncbi:O-antigen ligase family protein [Pseudomonas sp. TMB3-21]